MTSIFNYQTFDVFLNKDTRTLKITLGKKCSSLTLETLFELESLLAWCISKVEISTIFIDSAYNTFSSGHNQDVLQSLNEKQLLKFNKKLQKITQALSMLPQIIVVDLKSGAQNVGCELAIAADIRIAHKACKIQFDHAKLGILPCSGGISQLASIIGQANTKNWLLTAKKVDITKLEQSGLVFESYTQDNRQEVINGLLDSINKQASISRIQTKLGISENNRPQIDRMIEFENKIAKAALIPQDWKESKPESAMPAKSMKEAVKLTLIKNNNLPQ